MAIITTAGVLPGTEPSFDVSFADGRNC